MKNMFLRVGMKVDLTEEQFDLLVNNRLSKEELLEIIENGRIDGETYFPQEQYQIDLELPSEYEFCF